MQWQAVIGLEVHVQLLTQSKIFSGAANQFGIDANLNACAIDLGLPGVLPVLNQEAVRLAVKFGLAIDAHIAPLTIFARKNYFYPDLPKGYQISQLDHPIVGEGKLTVPCEDGESFTLNIVRAHLEEDAGKSLHEDFHGCSGIDLNRAGTPLLEIVTAPELHSAKQAVAYLKTLHHLVRYLGISDANMQEGSFRCDANVSVRKGPDAPLGTRAEIKNINSFRFVERAIDFEIERQIDLLESNQSVVQETRLYDADRDETRSMRGKEEANDYRYFPDPDLLPVEITPQLLQQIKAELPELPSVKRERFANEFALPDSDIELLTTSPAIAHYFEQCVSQTQGPAKSVANWMISQILPSLQAEQLHIEQCPVAVADLACLLDRITDQTLSSKTAKTVFQELWQQNGSVDAIIEAKGLKQLADPDALNALVEKVLADNQGQVEQYRSGNEKLLGFFVGQVMRASGGKANPAEVNKLLAQKLKAS